MKNKMMNSAVNNVSIFIKSLGEIHEELKGENFDFLLSYPDEEHNLVLSGQDAENYRNAFRTMIELIDDETISRKTIETILQKAIFTVIDLDNKRKDKSYADRLDEALKELRRSLNAEPVAFLVYYPVHGLAMDGLPKQVGNVKFCKFNSYQLKKYFRLIYKNEKDDQDKRNMAIISDSVKNSDILGKTIGLINIKAVDFDAAKSLAIKELSLSIDVMNFFSDLLPFTKSYIYLPGDSERLKLTVLSLSNEDKPKFQISWPTIGPQQLFSISRLIENDKKRRLGFCKVSKLLRKKRNKLEERLISAITWAGKATVERRKEEAFLLYIISLESLVLAENEKDELGYRLRTRVAHLIGKGKKGRLRVSDKMKDLYNIRSKIVHSGYYQVSDADLSLIRLYTKSCILKILNHRPFTTMDRIETLVDWFDGKILN